jgi:hypothetical protein
MPSDSDSDAAPKAPDLFTSLSEPTPSVVYETYWYLAAERQRIFFANIKDPYGHPHTDDPILQTYKFTNAYRASDRVSQYLIREVIYADGWRERSVEDTFFRILLFKIFNRISTWELLQDAFDELHAETFDPDAFAEVLESAMQANNAVYSGAYLMASGKRAFGQSRKHENHLLLLRKMLQDDLPQHVADAESMEAVFNMLLEYPTIGTFLAYQYATDINYSTITDFSEMEFVYPGPGAESGLRKCFEDPGDYDDSDLIRWMTERQQQAFERFDLDFQDLWGRPLQLIDCQNLFCEVDKYARKRHPGVEGSKGRTHIKAKFQPSLAPIPYLYPPKWDINDRIDFHDRTL